MGIADEKYVSLTTYKKDGTAVVTPVWVVGLEDGKVGFYTSSTSGKAKRLKNNSKVMLQPCNSRGKLTEGSKATEATAVIVEGAPRDAIYAKVVAKYGFMVKVTRTLAKVGGWIKRKKQPYADRGVVITLASD